MAGVFNPDEGVAEEKNNRKSEPEREPTEQEFEKAQAEALEMLSPKLDIVGRIPIKIANDVVGTIPRDLQKGIKEGDFEAAKNAIKYAEEVIRAELENPNSKKQKKWEKWLADFHALLQRKPRDNRDSFGKPEWDNPKHLHIPGSFAISYGEVAFKLFSRFAQSKEYFVRGKSMVRVVSNILEPVKDNSLRSIPEEYFEKVLAVNTEHDKVTGHTMLTTKKANMSKDLCAALLEHSWLSLLPEINSVVMCPVVYESKPGIADTHVEGYLDHAGGVYVSGGSSVKPESLDEAVGIIEDMLIDFDFPTNADRARAIAMIITPALVQGGFIKDRIPGDFAEADESQAGKGYRYDLVVAIYNDDAALVTQRLGGTGSFDEFFGDALLKGRTFIRMDNLRGKLDSPSLESFFTAPYASDFLARGFAKSGYVKAGRNILQASSNGLQGTRDISNRMCIVRIRKRPKTYKWRHFSEGDMLDHVRANQGKFLGAVHAVIGEWIRKDKPRSSENRHDFRQWAQTLDWILTNLFNRPGMLDGHREIQNRISSSIAGALREMAIYADKTSKLGLEFSASELISLAVDAGIEISGLKGISEDRKAQWLGTQLGAAYREAGKEVIQVDDYQCVRETTREPRLDGKGYIEHRKYRFQRIREA
jgi:hypothetical protein